VANLSPSPVAYRTEANSTTKDDGAEKVARSRAVLNQLTERIAEDRYVLAVVLVGGLSPETIRHRETLRPWTIEADGVGRRLPSDGNDERVLCILVEIGINVHAEVVPRGRSKTVEGASRTASSCYFFARRQIVYSKDPSIDTWFKQADSVATIIKGEGAAAQLATPYDYFTAVPFRQMGPFEAPVEVMWLSSRSQANNDFPGERPSETTGYCWRIPMDDRQARTCVSLGSLGRVKRSSRRLGRIRQQYPCWIWAYWMRHGHGPGHSHEAA
jgi:hypothetical protein